MKARFTNFSNGKPLNKCIFYLPMALSGLRKLDTIYDGEKVSSDQSECFFTYQEVLKMQGFFVSNFGTTVSSKYGTSNQFLNRVKRELGL